MSCYIPPNVLFNNPINVGFDVSLIQSCLMVNKEWYQCLNSIKDHVIKQSFKPFEYFTSMEITSTNTSFQLCHFYKMLEFIHSYINTPNPVLLKSILNKPIFNSIIGNKDKVHCTLKTLLTIHEYIASIDPYEYNNMNASFVILRVIVISYAFKYIEQIYNENITDYTQNQKLTNMILFRGNILQRQMFMIIRQHPSYKHYCMNVQRTLRYTLRCVRKYHSML